MTNRAIASLIAGLTTLGLVVGVAQDLAPRTVNAAAKPFLSYDAATHTAHITLIAGYNNANSGFNFDGKAKGALTITVPLGTRVIATFTDNASMPHSALIVKASAQVAAKVPAPAFAGAASTDYLNGTEKGDPASVFTFRASVAGAYRIVCGVPGHEIGGMWDWLIVKAGAKAATLQAS